MKWLPTKTVVPLAKPSTSTSIPPCYATTLGPSYKKWPKEAKRAKAIRIEGNCDERGTTEYNLALGDARARSAATYLERLGVHKNRISTVSYGSERPKVPGHDESAWSQNRRDDFRIQ